MTSEALPVAVGENGGLWTTRALQEAARTSLAHWIAEDLGPWQWFVTHTYAPKKVMATRVGSQLTGTALAVAPCRVGLQKMRKDIARFVVDVSKNMGVSVDVVAGIEPHETGSLHAHSLVRARRPVELGDVRAIHDAWYERHGYVLAVPAGQDAESRALYITKFERVAAYATKGQGDVFFSKNVGRV